MKPVSKRKIFITGGTGYIGTTLVHALISRGHEVRVLARESSQPRAAALLPAECRLVAGEALSAATFTPSVEGCDTFVQMVGVPHPNPSKAQAFRDIDLNAATAGLEAAVAQRVAHFLYLSVTQFGDRPAPAMRAYVASRAEAESRIAAQVRQGNIAATFLRPWYVLGPGHRWPLLLKPLYWLAGRIPALRANVESMGLVTREDMIAALVFAIEHPPAGANVIEKIDVPRIRELGTQSTFARK